MSKAFLSHSSRDSVFVRRLASDLAGHGVSVWIAEACIGIGDSLIDKISIGLEESDYVIAIISSNSNESEWVRKELHLAMNQEINSQKVRVIPVVIDDCKLPYFLTDKVYADFRSDEIYKFSLEKIVHTISKNGDSDPIRLSSMRPGLGEYDLGSLVHEKGEEWFGYRAVAYKNFSALGCLILICLVFLVTRLAPVNREVFDFGAQLIMILIVFGGSSYLAGVAFQLAFDRDKNLLLRIEKIGGYVIPFGIAWWRQYWSGKYSAIYRSAILVEGFGLIVSLYLLIGLLLG